MGFKDVVKKYNDTSLILRIVIGLIIGAIIAVIFKPLLADPLQTAPVVSFFNELFILFGSLFTGALKAVAPILVFFLVISALCNAKTAGSMKTVIVLYILSTFIAAVVAVAASFIFPTTVQLVQPVETGEAPQGIGEVILSLLMNIVSNPVDALSNANYIGILAWGVVLGIALRAASQNAKDVFGAVSDAISKVVRWVISLAPFGIMGLVYASVSQNGLEIFIDYGVLMAVLVGCMLFIAFVTNPVLVYVFVHRNPYPLILRCLKDSGITAFFTRSSAANIPVNMELCRKLGLDPDNYSVSIPLGATINMAGAAVTITVMTMTACHTLGIPVDPFTAIILSVLAAVSACGASGVAGGSLLLIPLACSLFGITGDVASQMIAIGFIISVVQDSCETALNSSSDVVFTATADYRAQIKAGKEPKLGRDNFSLDEID